MKSIRNVATVSLAAIGSLWGSSLASATPILTPELASFAVLGALGVTNVPTSTIGGNLGSAPNASVGGGYIFTTGSMQQNTALAQQAQLDLDAAITNLNLLGPGDILLDPDLTGTRLPGVYTVPAGPTNLSGLLTLDGGGDNAARWVFLMRSTLITSTTSNVELTRVGDGSGIGIYWVVPSAATLNGPTFEGNVLAHDLISSDGSLRTNCGRLLSATSQVTLNQDTISIGCVGNGYAEAVAIGLGGTGGSNGQIVYGVPEPATFALLGLGLAGLGFSRRKKA